MAREVRRENPPDRTEGSERMSETPMRAIRASAVQEDDRGITPPGFQQVDACVLRAGIRRAD